MELVTQFQANAPYSRVSHIPQERLITREQEVITIITTVDMQLADTIKRAGFTLQSQHQRFKGGFQHLTFLHRYELVAALCIVTPCAPFPFQLYPASACGFKRQQWLHGSLIKSCLAHRCPRHAHFECMILS